MESLISNVEAGQFWRLKNGDHARITSVSPLELMPICGMILERAEHALWTAGGRATSNITVLSTDLDLDVQVTFVLCASMAILFQKAKPPFPHPLKTKGR